MCEMKLKNLTYSHKCFKISIQVIYGGAETIMKIRDVNVEDAKYLLDIYGYYVLNTAISFEEKVPTLLEFEDRIKNISAKYPYLVATHDDGSIVGYAYAHAFGERSAYRFSVELSIYLARSERRRGLGRTLYEEMEKRLKTMGIKNMCACITSPRGESKYVSNDSINFHTKMGFSMVGKFVNIGYKFNEWIDVVWMQKEI